MFVCMYVVLSTTKQHLSLRCSIPLGEVSPGEVSVKRYIALGYFCF